MNYSGGRLAMLNDSREVIADHKRDIPARRLTIERWSQAKTRNSARRVGKRG